MRLGLVVLSAAAVTGGTLLVNTISSRPAFGPAERPPAAEAERDLRPGSSAAPPPETRRYELIRYVTKDGSFGMVDDPTRVPPGATIVGRERKTVVTEKPAAPEPFLEPELEEEERLERMLEQRHQAGQRLAAAQRRIAESVLGSGLFPRSETLGKLQGELDTMQQEADRMNDCADGDCPALAPAAAGDELRSAVPRPVKRR
jgi:hypothetical protein